MKRILALIMVFAIVLSLQNSVMALSENNFSDNEKFDKSAYYSYTINFEKDSKSVDLRSLNTENNNIEKAKEYVLSLNLESCGYKDIEEACLEQLNELEKSLESTNKRLTSYSVLIPKNRSATYSYFGSLNGKNFYTSYYSSYNLETEIRQYSTTSKIQSWVLGGINFILSLPGLSAQVTVPWAVISNLMGAPQNYTVNGSAYLEHYALSEHNSRGIYWRENTSTYTLVYSDESGFAELWLVYHPVDTNYDLMYPRQIDTVDIYSDNFFDEEYILDSAHYAALRDMVFRDPIYVHNTELDWS